MILRKYITLFILFFCITSFGQNTNDFVFDVVPVTNDTYRFILSNTTPVIIDWGDGQQSSIQVGNNQNIPHVYNSNTIRTITVSGNLSYIKIFKDVFTRVTQWGNSQWINTSGSFRNLNNIQFTSTDTPDFSQVTNMSYMFEESRNFNSDISNWDVSNVTNMSYMFAQATSFNMSLNNWDVSNVAFMEKMFFGAWRFNQSINNWDVSNVVNMERMFWFATDFNQPLNNWNTSSLQNVLSMFSGATDFNQNINNWDVSNISSTEFMFDDAVSFNQPLNNWDVTNINNMFGMFADAQAFNQNLDNWDVSNVGEMTGMFSSCQSFNQDLSSWQFSTGVNLTGFITFSGLNTSNYDKLLESLSSQNINPAPNFTVGGLKYCNTFYRNVLIQQGWSINGDQLDSNCNNNLVNGLVQFDADANGCDLNDPIAVNVKILISNSTINSVNYSDNFGNFSSLISDGQYTITPNPENPSYWNFSPPNVVVDFSTQASPFTQDFCVTANGTVEDLEVIVVPLEQARPGFDVDYKVVIKNKGNVTASGSVTLDFEEDFMTLLSSTPNAGNTPSNQLSWSFSGLQPFQMEEYAFTMTLNTLTQATNPLNSNDILTFTGTVTGTGTDAMPADNTMVFDQTVVNSYDPNDKTCLEGKVIEPSLVGEYVHYMIRFENTGTASAVNIVVKDDIDLAQFDITTLIPLGGSHDYYTRVRDNNVVEFIHENINLDFNDATNDGYVLFKIKTLPTLIEGDTFDNTAEIYFDFNAPIITNTESVTIMSTASIGETTDTSISVYPNPARDFINISSTNGLKSATLIDVNGRQLSQTNFIGNTTEQRISLENLTSGVYFVTIQSEVGQKVEKVIVD